MIPILFQFGFVKIYTFGVFLVLAFFWMLFLIWKNVKLTSYKEEDIFDGVFISILGSIFFARLFYVAVNFSDFGFSFLKFILINGYPGLSLFGGIFGGFLSFYWFCKSKKIDFLEITDYISPSIFLALCIGKMGSFFAGVDVGVKTKFFLSVKYLGYKDLRHLTAFYEALIFAIGVYFATKILMSIRKGMFKKGFVFYFFIFYFSVTNLFLDKIKENPLYFFGQSFNLIISGIVSLGFFVYYIFYFKNEIKNTVSNLIIFIKKHGQKNK